MFKFWESGKAILAAGGDAPRVVAFDIVSLEIVDEFMFEPGHTPYPMDLADDRRSLVVGTRRRHARVFRKPGCSDNSEAGGPLSIEMSAPVLSVCFVSGPGIVVSDDGGQCVRARTVDAPIASEDLYISGKKVCALFAFADTVVGWATDGSVLFVELPGLDPPTVVPGPIPPDKYALARLVRWDADTLVSLAGDGSLFEIDVVHRNLRVKPAHRGECYALAIDGHNLITIGRRDGRCKVWELGGDDPVAEYEAPSDIIAAIPVAGLEGALLLVDYGGNAGIWAVHGDRLVLESQVSGCDYRTALGVPAQELAAIRAEKTQREIISIIHKLSNPGSRLGPQEIEEEHAKLAALGAPRASLKLQIDAIRAQQDTRPVKAAEEIRLHSALMALLPDEECALEPMFGYIEALKSTWLLDEICKVYDRVRRIAPEHVALKEAPWLAEQADAIRCGTCVADPGTSEWIARSIECAAAIEQPFIGRFILNRFPPIPLSGADLNLQQVCTKYEAIRSNDTEMSAGLPELVHEHVSWLSKEDHCRKELLVPREGLRAGPAQLRIALAWSPEKVLFEVPVLFEVGLPGGASGFEGHNAKAKDGLKVLRSEYVAHASVQQLYKAFQSVVGRLVNESIHARLEGGFYEPAR